MVDVIRTMIEYSYRELANGIPSRAVLKHLKGAFKGKINSKIFKKLIFCNEKNDDRRLNKLNQIISEYM